MHTRAEHTRQGLHSHSAHPLVAVHRGSVAMEHRGASVTAATVRISKQHKQRVYSLGHPQHTLARTLRLNNVHMRRAYKIGGLHLQTAHPLMAVHRGLVAMKQRGAAAAAAAAAASASSKRAEQRVVYQCYKID